MELGGSPLGNSAAFIRTLLIGPKPGGSPAPTVALWKGAPPTLSIGFSGNEAPILAGFMTPSPFPKRLTACHKE
jgi:hypothetical protein